jgi:hypothetical protein
MGVVQRIGCGDGTPVPLTRFVAPDKQLSMRRRYGDTELRQVAHIFGRPASGEVAQDERHPDSVALDAWFSEADLGSTTIRESDVISHDSALDLWDLCDVNPTKIHATVPKTSRVRRPPAYAVHVRDLDAGDLGYGWRRSRERWYRRSSELDSSQRSSRRPRDAWYGAFNAS